MVLCPSEPNIGIVPVCIRDCRCVLYRGSRRVRRNDVRGLAQGSCAQQRRKQNPRRGDKAIADSFVEDVRHGLVHDARLNRGAEFSLDIEQPMTVLGSVLVVNPLELLRSVEVRWQMTLHNIRENPEFHHRTASQIRRVFKADFEADEVWESDKSLKVGRQLP